MDNFSLFPLHEMDNPETENLDPSRRDRVHIPPDLRQSNCPLNDSKILKWYLQVTTKNKLWLKRPAAFTALPPNRVF